MEETTPKDFEGEEKPPQFKVNPYKLERNLGKVVGRAIEAVPKIEKSELDKGLISILELSDLKINALKSRSNIVVFSYQHACHGEKRWRTLAVKTDEYDPENLIRRAYEVPDVYQVIIHGITLLPQVDFQSNDRSMVLCYDGDFQFWLLHEPPAAA